VKGSTKVVLAGAAAIAVLSVGFGIGTMLPLASAKDSKRAANGEATAPVPAAAAPAGGAAGPTLPKSLSGVSGGAAGVRALSGVSGGVADLGSNPYLIDPAGSPIGNAVAPAHAVTATLTHPAAKPPAPVKARTVSTVPAPKTPAPAKTTKKKTSASSGSGSVAPVVLSGDQPGPGNTGVPSGTALTVHDGDLTITTAGATYSGLDIHGFVKVEAPNVTIKDSIIRGGVAPSDIGLVNDTDDSATNFLIEDSELVPMDPSVQIDGIKGWNYTALRVDIHGTTDGAKMYGPNATIEDSYIHGLVTYAHDPDHGGGESHNDGVQILSGSNLKIIGNTIEGGSNTALMITQDHGTTSNVVFDNNWVSGGACSINMTPEPLGSLSGITLDNNIFTDNSTKHCPILDTTHTDLNVSGNVFAGTGLPVPVNNKGAN
jgi:Right handed beta helix region